MTTINKNVIKLIFQLFIFFTIVACFTSNATARIYYDTTFEVVIIENEPSVDILMINESIDNADIVSPMDNNVWLVNGAIYSKNSTVYLNGTQISELRLAGNSAKSKLLYGYNSNDVFRIHDISITGWDLENDKAALVGGIALYNSEFHDVHISYSTAIQIYDNVIGTLSDITISNSRDFWLEDLKNTEVFNINIFDGNPTSAGAFYTLNCDHLLIHDVKITNISHLNGVLFKSMTNSEFYNINVSHVGSYLEPKTGYLGISLSEGYNNYGHDLFINDTGWSGFGAAAMEDNSRFKNIIIKNSGHNGVDIHPAKNLVLESVKVYDSVSNNVIVTAGYQTSPAAENIYFKDFYLENGGAQFSDNVTNITFEDVSIMNGSFKSFGTKDVTVINMSMDHGADYRAFDEYFLYTKIGSYNVQNGIVIDSSFYRFGTYYTDNALAINTKYQLLSYKNDLAEYYYPQFKVIDSNGINLVGGNLEISNEIDSSIKSVDGYGNEISVFSLDTDGSTFSPMVNRVNAPAIAVGKYATDNSYTAYSYSADFTSPSGDTVTLTDITPDSTWYREDPNIPTYTITAIIPDASSTEPQITGYAPSSDNPFTAGESKKFQVWADQEMTTMKWYVNGNLVSSGSMDYTWKVESGTSTIMFSGVNSNGGVTQIWEITEGEVVEEDAPVSSGTGISFTPSATSMTATSGESTTFSVETSQEFTSAVWSLDGVEVESDATEHVETWATAGTHTVTFDGTAAAGTISQSWSVLVSEAAESEYSAISISPSTTTVAPGESFSLDVYIDPTQALTGSQFDLQYSQLATISTVSEGELFTASGLATTFQYDSINNAAGLLDNVYAAIVGSGTITSPGVMATIEMVAGSSSGLLDIELANVILSDANSNPAGYTVSNATVLIDTAPQFTTVLSQTVEEEQSLTFTAAATDADGDDLSYTATSLPSGSTFNGGSFSWIPSEGDAGSYVATFEVTDGYLTDTVSVSITVTPMNHIPEITLFEPADGTTFEEGSTIGVNVAATDADGDSLSYIIEIDGVQVSTSASYSWTTDYESAGIHIIKVTVSDGTDEVSSSGTITITDLQPRWDVNEDGIVNVLDITLVGQNYGKTYTADLPRWDVNQDGTVNIQDLSIVSGHFGESV